MGRRIWRRLTIRAAETDANEVKPQAPDKAPPVVVQASTSFLVLKEPSKKQEYPILIYHRSIIEIRGLVRKSEKRVASSSSFINCVNNHWLRICENKWKIRLQLTKPVTWPPLVWGVICGAAASGNFQWNLEDVAKSIVCMMMSGPFLTGYTQTLNDYYDREIDAINEPYRPIPSGAISENEEGLAWLVYWMYGWAGQALFGTLTPDIIVLTLLYSIAGLGIAIVNDFKSIEGDRALGLQSLPVAFGAETAKWICVGAIDITQISVAGYLLGAGKPYYALALLALILPQIVFQFQYFLKDPVKYDVKYQASAQPFLVLGLLVTALATSH
ncbi:hypothetical protein GH714_017844 [Hevea brasiliensis]|uniref:Chlorophyll synthase n=1 Tax=Hevea brasiliensis TaxID=3981 RepID=A0A6A6M1M6_HEVBR|nr:hypothetical protein GH714_017844 [Hevea brasiliensis]